MALTDIPWAGATGQKLYVTSGTFTSTLKTSEDVSAVDTSPRGVSWDGTNSPWAGAGDSKLYLTSGQFTSTVKTSYYYLAIDGAAAGISWDGTNTPWGGAGSDKLYLQSGQITSTMKTSIDQTAVDNGVRGISFDGTNTPWCGTEAGKLYLQSGQFTSTIKDSESIGGVDTGTRGISWNGTNTPWTGTTADKLYLQSGQFTSTLKTSESIGGVETGIGGLEVNDVDARLGVGGGAVEVTPAAISLTTTQPAPTVTVDFVVSPAAISLSTTQPAPTVTVDFVVSPAAISLSTTQPAPVLTVDFSVSPAAIALSTTQPAPTLSYNITVSPAAIALSPTLPAPSTAANVIVTPSAISLTPTIPALSLAINFKPAAIALSPTLPAPTIPASVSPAAIALTPTIPAPTVSITTTLTIEGNDTFAVGDIIRIKDGTNDEWLEITNATNAPSYGVTRDKAGAYGAGANPAWKAGAAVVNYGQSGDGGIYLTADDTNAPYLSIFDHAGSPWTTINTRLRLGNLNGYLGYSADIYGLGIGSSDANQANLTFDPTNGIRIRSATTDKIVLDNSGNAYFASSITIGDGSTTSGTLTLNHAAAQGDTYIAGGTINASAWTATSGFILGIDDSDSDKCKFYLGTSGNSIDWNVTSLNTLTITGSITATTGAIGGWVIGATSLSSDSGAVGMSSEETGGNDIRFWAGNATPASAPYRVYEDGSFTATSATITGAITISSGSGVANLSDAGALAVEDDLDGVPDGSTYNKTTVNEVTGAGRAYNDINSSGNFIGAIDPGHVAPTGGGAGLYLGSDYLGYYSGSAWNAYIASTGNFKFAGSASNYIEWNGSTLAVVGSGVFSTTTGARVEIFGDANTGIEVIDDGANSVFKALIGGTDIGDVVMGDESGGKYAKWDKSASTFVVSGDLLTISVLTAGATINGATLPVPVYQSTTDNELYACDADDSTKLGFIGFAITNSTDGNDITLQTEGIVDGFSGLDEGELYYVQDAVGTIGTTPGTYKVLVGRAISTTEIKPIILDVSYVTEVIASDVLKISADTERTTTSASYVKLKEIQIHRGGVARVKFDLKGVGAGGVSGYGRIYLNGVAEGTEQTDDDDYTTYSEDITVSVDDLIQLYAHRGDVGDTAYVRNFRIYYDLVSTADIEVITD